MPKTLKVKAVLFDLGDTLVKSHPEKTMQKILEAHGIVKSIDSVKNAIIRGSKEFDVEKHLNMPVHEFYKEWNMVNLKHLEINDKAIAEKLAIDMDVKWFEFAKIHVYRDVKETLHRLKKLGLKLGLVTGGYELDLKQILPKVSLEGFFDVCVGVDTTGKRKPSPEAFLYALEKLNVKPEEAIFVGDDLERDYQGAQRIGMRAIMINRKGKPIADVKSITSLRQILDFL